MKKKFKSIFVSDIHLGTINSKAEYLIKFLDEVKADEYFLVGDIIDVWAISKGRSVWPQTHNDVIRKFLSKARNGSKVHYIIGNHESNFRHFIETMATFGNFDIQNECDYISVNGKKYLITHGDLYDVVILGARKLSFLGDWAYTTLLRFNRFFNYVRIKVGLPYWSISKYAKSKVKHAIDIVTKYRESLIVVTKEKGYDGILSGHVHTPELTITDDGITVLNTGDWVETCSAVAETYEGEWVLFELVDNEMKIVKSIKS